ncbi:MAG: GNAT family N-acetyltransferase, partial [Undibacterium sp.]|nr:GNAT family N-acetyltransferase [Undibacterium sp.]
MPSTLSSAEQTNTAMSDISYRHAVGRDAESIAVLVNSGYRGDSSRAGWTTEANLLTGERINAQEVRDIIDNEHAVILLCLQNDIIIGCVQLVKVDNSAYFGMFVVQPGLQGAGIGKRFMQTAEILVQA